MESFNFSAGVGGENIFVSDTKMAVFSFCLRQATQHRNHLSEAKMKAKGTLKEYRVIGRKMPTESEPVTPLYR